jgi:riboflavin kinase / FMN adenylyltransferase
VRHHVLGFIMRIISSHTPLPQDLRGCVVAIGNFDGMHRGHQQLLATAKTLADKMGKPWGVVTFEPHPRSFFKPHEPVFRVTPFELKSRLIAATGADFLVALDFDAALANQEHGDFVDTVLMVQLGASHIVSGYDFHFGKARKGNPAALLAHGAAKGFGVTIVNQVSDEDAGHSAFSSSSIRNALRHGHMEDASHELGYPWMVLGEVVPGDQRGRTIGFPTANIIVEPGTEPARGIYAVFARDIAGGPTWMGAGYFGDRPTFNTNRTFLEVYLLDQDIDLYGKTLLVSFISMIRPDKSFTSVEDLIAQMKDDCKKARDILAKSKVPKHFD